MKLNVEKIGYRKRTMKLNTIIVSVVSVLLVIILCCGPVGGQNEEVDKNSPLRFKRDIDTFVEWDSKNSVPDDAVLFVGSSSIRMWPTCRSFPDMKVINRGFGGSQISDVIYYSDRVVLPYKPKVIVFYAGDNDVAAGKSAEQVLVDYRKFIKIVRKATLKTPVIFIAIKPSLSRWKLWPEMKRANDMIEDYCDMHEWLSFVEISVALLGKDGKPDEKLFLDDQLHLSAKGYTKWTAMLRPVIQKAYSNTKEKACCR
jgi:lysophospholipase L1-like esterase